MSAEEDLVLDRSGHMPSWVFDRLRLDPAESAPEFFAAADRHLAACERCRAMRAAQDAEVAALPALPPRRRAVASRGASRAWWVGGAGVLAAAAVALLMARAPSDDLIAKGSRLDFEVHVDSGAGAALVWDGALVRPGARVGFRLRAEADGHALVFGWDDGGVAYPIFPASGERKAAPWAASKSPETLPAAIAFDAVGSAEHLVAVWCPNTFELGDLEVSPRVERARLEAAVKERGCLLRMVHLVKARQP